MVENSEGNVLSHILLCGAFYYQSLLKLVGACIESVKAIEDI